MTTICFLYYVGFGPFVNILAIFEGCDLTLYHNIGFTWKGAALPIKIFQLMNWLLTLSMPCMLIGWCYSTGNWSFMALHEAGFDMVFSFQLVVMLFTRAWMISMKYATFTDKNWRRIHEEIISAEDIRSELMVPAWLVIKPDLLMKEVAMSLVRQDVEPRFFTFRSFSDFGTVSEKKFTDMNYNPWAVISDKEFNLDKMIKSEK